MRGGRRRGWSDEDLRSAVAGNTSILGVLRALGRKPGGEMYVSIKAAIARLGLETDHFVGQGWRKGNRSAAFPAAPFEEVLVKGRPTNTNNLRMRLLRSGLKGGEVRDLWPRGMDESTRSVAAGPHQRRPLR